MLTDEAPGDTMILVTKKPSGLGSFERILHEIHQMG